MLGRLLDQRYQVIQVLGEGGFGHTYIAEDTRRPGNPTCVVKHLKPATSDPDFLQTARRLFKSEAETLEKLGNHDQIPRLLAYFEEEEEFYLVEEFVAGHPLIDELPPGHCWNESQVIQFLQEVLSILDFVHTNGVIHRDLKPENLIRRSSDNKLVLVDFGAVKQVQMQSIITQGPIEQTVAIGTPGYMPSEQGQGRPRQSSDIYALGIIGIQALTGLNPRQLSEDSETGEIIWRDQAQVSNGLAAVLSQMVRHYFKHRYQSATEALQALDSLTKPNTPGALAAVVRQAGGYYLRNSYQSASQAMRSFQELAKSYISTNRATSPKSIPPSATSTPSPRIENRVTISPGNSSGSPISLQSLWGIIARFPHKIPLLFGAGTVTVVIAIATTLATRQPVTSPVNSQNISEIKTPQNNKPDKINDNQKQTITTQDNIGSNSDKTKSEPNKKPDSDKNQQKNNCLIVLDSSNVRSVSGRKKTGQVIKPGTKVSVTGKEEDGWIEINSPVSGWIWKSRTKNTCSR